jgi:L-2,4-diaminobutyrate decarboxylase
MVLFREPEAGHDAVSFGGSYLAAPNVGLLGSHGDTALPLAATLLAWGRPGLRDRLDADMALAGRLADLVDAQPDLELWRRPVTGVVNPSSAVGGHTSGVVRAKPLVGAS